jgi:hypothetical protein
VNLEPTGDAHEETGQTGEEPEEDRSQKGPCDKVKAGRPEKDAGRGTLGQDGAKPIVERAGRARNFERLVAGHKSRSDHRSIALVRRFSSRDQ